jgi:lipopolysaccharide assembly protein B
MLTLWPLLLPVAAASGWVYGHRAQARRDQDASSLSRDYYVGLNYLLNEQHDKALDIFLRLLKVDTETVEMHLALGSLFRRRGEVDRAIRIHQNLIARPQLSKQQRLNALLALGQDYLRAGVLDRAERIFHEIVNTPGNHDQAVVSLRSLLDIYQQEKSWQQAISIAHQLELASNDSMHRVMAHHYCELAEEAFTNKQYDVVTVLLKKALQIDRTSVRASLLQARLLMHKREFKAAIKCYQRVKVQDSNFISEIIPPLVKCYEQLGQEHACMDYLQQLLKEYPRMSIAKVIAEEIKQQRGTEAAADYMAEQLQHYPSIRGLDTLIEWHIASTYGKVKDKLQVLKTLTTELLKDKPVYRCEHCGISGKQLHWQCPGCKQWDTSRPIHGLEGD